jgi:hypothetical protein
LSWTFQLLAFHGTVVGMIASVLVVLLVAGLAAVAGGTLLSVSGVTAFCLVLLSSAAGRAASEVADDGGAFRTPLTGAKKDVKDACCLALAVLRRLGEGDCDMGKTS